MESRKTKAPKASEPTFIDYLIMPLLPKGRARPLTPEEVRAANHVLAAVLDYVDVGMARRLRECVPGYRCNLKRLCAYCGQVRANDIVDKRKKLLHGLRGRAVHLTLTPRGTPRLSRWLIQSVIDRVYEFRHLPSIRAAVAGGIVNIHVGHSGRNGGWLVHAHLLIDYLGGLSDREVRDAWASLGDGWQAKPKTVNPGDEGRVLRYGAALQPLPLDKGLIREFLQAVPGLAMIRAWGTLHPLYGRPRGRQDPTRPLSGPGGPS